MRAVIDTGVYVSGLIRRRGTTGSVFQFIRDGKFVTIYSTDILVEIIDVLSRDKFRHKYQIEPGDVTALVNLIRLRGELVIPSQRIQACRDPKDDKFLEAAISGNADYLLSGDADLLDLQSFENIPIITPADFLDQF